MERNTEYAVKRAPAAALVRSRIITTTVLVVQAARAESKGMDDRVYSPPKSEPGLHLPEGEYSLRLKEIAEALGTLFQPMEAFEILKGLCAAIDVEGLADVVRLPELGSDPGA